MVFGKKQSAPELDRQQTGLPGAPVRQEDAPIDGKLAALLLSRTQEQQRKMIGEDEIREAAAILQRYKQGKANLESRVVEDELWWELRHWEAIGRNNDRCKTMQRAEPTSAWLFNAILNKHADAMDNIPEAVVLPREPGDRDSAKTLQEVIPVVMEQNGFENTYSNNWWEKLKHGTAVYGVFWNPAKENGLGDVDIRQIDLLNIFWEPGITDIQKSRNLFVVELVDAEALEAQYPQYKGRLGGSSTIDVQKYIYDDTVDTSDKVAVVDWYYKRRAMSGKTVLHYAKFCGDCLLYASENHAEYAENGWYEDGRYPVVFDSLFPEKGTPVGFGYVCICKDPQLYIDKLFGNILDYAIKASKPRTFVSQSAGINEEEYLDWDKPLIHVEGQIDSGKLQQLTMDTLPSIYASILQLKIDEMKETSANRDVNSGGGSSGVTAAAAISALQEAGNKASRDMISASYRAHTQIVDMVIERMRQFYDVSRAFRITAAVPMQPGIPSAGGQQEQFVDFSNAGLRNQPVGQDSNGQTLYRKPVFDLKIKAQKKNPFSRMEQNQRALELYSAGFFAPENAQAALGALHMMEFEGKQDVTDYVQQGQTLLNVVQQLTQEVQRLAAMMAAQTGAQAIRKQDSRGNGRRQAQQTSGGVQGRTVDEEAARAQRSGQTSYQQQLAERAAPNMDMGNPNG